MNRTRAGIHCREHGSRHPAPRFLALGGVLLLLLGLVTLPSPAQEIAAGRIDGSIFDAANDQPLSTANIVLSGTQRGTVSQEDGSFFIDGLAPGEYDVVVSFIGYREVAEQVTVPARGSVRVHFRLERTIAARLEAISVRAERQVIDITKTSASHRLSSEDLETVVTQTPTIDQVVAQQPGVVSDRGRLHIRGGRADENIFLIDGISVKDLLSGEARGSEISVRSARQVNVMTGGFGARYNQAMSGVVETQLKEGSRRWHGSLSYDTDFLLGNRNLHNFYGELGGPNLPLAALLRLLGSDRPAITFYASLSCDFTDAYMDYVRDEEQSDAIHSSLENSVLGRDFKYGRFFYPAAENTWRAIFKSAWKANPDNKFSLTMTKSLAFHHDWGSPDIGEIDRGSVNFPWNWVKNLDGHYTNSSDVNLLSLQWNRTLGTRARTSLRLWRQYSGSHKDVRGKHWAEYDPSRDTEERDNPDFEDTPFFVDVGDAPDWRDRYVVVWGLANDWNCEVGAHRLEWGLTAEYHDVQYIAINALTVQLDSSPPLPLGDEFDLFHVTPNVGNIFLQDSFDYEGMVVNLGLTYDYWFPGPQAQQAIDDMSLAQFTPALREQFYADTHSAFGYRYKSHLAPRLGLSFPISDRAHLFFNYGHYSQRPPYYYVYAKSSSQSGENYPRIGNPNLNPKISISYEIGSEHQLSQATALKMTLFWKDMYDYPTTTTLTLKERDVEARRSEYFMYWNKDYTRSAGVELTLQRKLHNFLSGSLSYTYSVAKGKSSDPNATKVIQETGGDAREVSLEEEFLWWNRPHKLTAQMNVRIRRGETPPRWFGFRWPRDFSLRLYYRIRSGRPYTPTTIDGRELGVEYSSNSPFTSTLDLSLSKGFSIRAQRVQYFFNVYNLLNHRSPHRVDPATGEAYRIGAGSLANAYPYDNAYDYEEAYYYNNSPVTYTPSRSLRMGLRYDW